MNRLFFLLGIIFLVLSFMLILSSHQGAASKILVYAFELMVVGTILYLFQLFRSQR